jgi:DNA/RNA endonuclease G (NUC1)
METKFGRSFGDVRIFADAHAEAAATSLRARAYTEGHDIAFARGRYQPETSEGRALLTHELAHVAQQHRLGRAPLLSPLAAERAAERAAVGGASEAQAPVLGAVPPGLQCADNDDESDNQNQSALRRLALEELRKRGRVPEPTYGKPKWAEKDPDIKISSIGESGLGISSYGDDWGPAKTGALHLDVMHDHGAGRPDHVQFYVPGGEAGVRTDQTRNFKRDESVPGAQPGGKHLEGTDWERGHLAPLELSKFDHSWASELNHMTNIVPMSPALNRGENTPWRAAENRMFELAQEHGGVRVYMKPIYEHDPPRLPNGIPIPKSIIRRTYKLNGERLREESFENYVKHGKQAVPIDTATLTNIEMGKVSQQASVHDASGGPAGENPHASTDANAPGAATTKKTRKNKLKTAAKVTAAEPTHAASINPPVAQSHAATNTHPSDAHAAATTHPSDAQAGEPHQPPSGHAEPDSHLAAASEKPVAGPLAKPEASQTIQAPAPGVASKPPAEGPPEVGSSHASQKASAPAPTEHPTESKGTSDTRTAPMGNQDVAVPIVSATGKEGLKGKTGATTPHNAETSEGHVGPGAAHEPPKGPP